MTIALAAAGPAFATPTHRALSKAEARLLAVDRDRKIDRGIVQSVSASAIVLKQLDGSTVSVPVNARTRVFVNGRAASLSDIKPGFVALVKHEDNKPAQEIRAFGRRR